MTTFAPAACEHVAQAERDIEVVRRLGVAVVGLRAGRVARARLRADEDRPRDLGAVRVVAAVVAGVDRDRCGRAPRPARRSRAAGGGRRREAATRRPTAATTVGVVGAAVGGVVVGATAVVAGAARRRPDRRRWRAARWSSRRRGLHAIVSRSVVRAPASGDAPAASTSATASDRGGDRALPVHGAMRYSTCRSQPVPVGQVRVVEVLARDRASCRSSA